MIIKRLIIKSFGKLKNLSVELKPELNIIYADNEFRKTALKTFIKSIFYGLKRKTHKNEMPEFDKYMPLDSSDFSGSIEYTFDNTVYHVTRDFITNEVVVLNKIFEDTSILYPNDNNPDFLFAESHLSLNEECFEDTAFINHLETTKKIFDILTNIQETGSESTSYKNFIDTIKNSLTEDTEINKTIGKPINIIEAEIEQLIKDKHESIQMRNTIFELNQEINENEIQKLKFEKQIDYLNQFKLLLNKNNLLEMYRKAKNYEDTIENVEKEIATLSKYRDFPIDLEETLKELLIKIENNKKILDQKTLKLKQIDELYLKFHHDTLTPPATAHALEVLSQFEDLQRLISQKNNYQGKLNQNIAELDRLKEASASSFSSSNEPEEVHELKKKQMRIKNKLIEIEKLMKVVKNFEYLNIQNIQHNNGDSAKAESTDATMAKYKQLSDLRQKKYLTEREIKNFEKDLFLQNDIISKLSKFRHLPSDIEDVIMKLQDNISLSYNCDSSEVINTTYKIYWYQILSDILVFIISFVLFLYGLFHIQANASSVAYLISVIGLVGVIAFTVKTIASFKKFLSVKNSIAQKAIESQPLDYDSVKAALEKIYSSVDVNDFSTFMKSLYVYKDAIQKIKMLNVDLNFKKQSLEGTNYEINQLQSDISNILNKYNIQHDPNNINEIDMANLRYAVKTDLSESDVNNTNLPNDLDQLKDNILQSLVDIVGEKTSIEDIPLIYNRCKQESSDIENKLNSLGINSDPTYNNNKLTLFYSNFDLLQHENEQIKDIIYKLIENIIDLDKSIKDELSKRNIEFKEDELVDEILIETLKSNLERDIKASEEVQNTDILKSGYLCELEVIKNDIIIYEKDKDNLLEAAGAVSCDEFFSSCENRKKLELLLQEKTRLENIHQEVINDISSESILEKISQAKNELNIDINNIESIEEIDIKISEYQTYLKQLNEKDIQLKTELNEKNEKSNNLNQIVEKIEYLSFKKQGLHENKEALQIAADIMKQSQSELHRKFIPRFQSELSDIISKITHVNYNTANIIEYINTNFINDKFNISDNLSIDTKQLYLTIKIALSSTLSSQNSSLPLFIDENFFQYDSDRIKNTLTFLNMLSKQRQIIIFTCQKFVFEIIEELGIKNNINVVELNEINS